MAFICQFCGAFDCKPMGEMTGDNRFICSKLEIESKCKICNNLLNVFNVKHNCIILNFSRNQ